MPGESRFTDLEPLLAQVAKPVQYLGGEINSTAKQWQVAGFGPTGEELTVRWVLTYPDAYEVGLPNQGLMILYEVLNERPDVLAERTYAVWPDLEALQRRHGVPQLTLESHRAVREFDVLGVSLSTELGYTNLLTILDLSGISLHAGERGDDDPIVLAGGHVSFNPEPIADFVDAVVVGDGEEAVLAVTDVVSAWKAEGRPGVAPRCCSDWLAVPVSMCPRSMTSATCRTGGSAGCHHGMGWRACRGGWPSTP